MGFSLAAAFAVIGVSILISIEILTGSLLPTITNFDDSYDDMIDREINRVQTDINITSVSTSANDSNYDHNITLENTGSVTLKTSDFTIMINGTVQPFSYSNSYLYPEKIVYFNIYNLAGNGSKRLKVVTDNGISDYYDYSI